jgi:hypothetical protein
MLADRNAVRFDCPAACAGAPRRLTCIVISRRLLAVVTVISLMCNGCGKQPERSPPAPPKRPPSKPLAAPPEVTSAEEGDEYRDLVFYIQDHKRLPDGSQSIRAAGTHQGRQVGFEVVLTATWQPMSLGKDVIRGRYAGHVIYRSTGPDSDALIQALDEVYGTKLDPGTMAAQTQFNGISLMGNPGDLAQGPVRIKQFFESGKQDEYAELFTFIDFPAHRLEVCEKDDSYRSRVVKALQPH